MTLKEYYRINDKVILAAIKSALREDKIKEDLTTRLLFSGKAGAKREIAVLWCKEDCVLAGLEIFKRVYREIDSSVRFTQFSIDGAKLKKGTKVMLVKGPLRTLLTGERTALNFLQRMSGTATLTDSFVRQLKFKNAKILHTRKTTPNFRVFEAAAVKTGGGDFHRLSLDSSVMIKDNHIEAFGGIEEVFRFLEKRNLTTKQKQKFEIEVKGFKEIGTVLKYGKGLVEVVMLDNFKPGDIERAARILKINGFEIEVSGGINIGNFGKYQKKAIDFYSIGALTHSCKSCDFSLDF
jgi:nicotinate-nucleotide pyrophosphorylase (carboxylating)